MAHRLITPGCQCNKCVVMRIADEGIEKIRLSLEAEVGRHEETTPGQWNDSIFQVIMSSFIERMAEGEWSTGNMIRLLLNCESITMVALAERADMAELQAKLAKDTGQLN